MFLGLDISIIQEAGAVIDEYLSSIAVPASGKIKLLESKNSLFSTQ